MSSNPDQSILKGASDSLQQTLELGERLAELLQPGDVVALLGPLGAGKTQLVRGLASGLDVDPRLVASPTFVLMSEYPGRVPLVHVDAYRMDDASDLESIGWSEELFAEAITAVEWADRIEPHLPEDHLRVELSHDGEERRSVTIELRGAWAGDAEEIQQILDSLVATRPCPTCGTRVAENSEHFPFCSRTCRYVDLNQWFTGGYRISAPLGDTDHSENETEE